MQRISYIKYLGSHVNIFCLCSNYSQDARVQAFYDPDLLDVVGQATIPNAHSLRCPPARVAHHSTSERLIGITHRNAARRYLQKLQKERERNKEVLTECVENLPLVIRYVADHLLAADGNSPEFNRNLSIFELQITMT